MILAYTQGELINIKKGVVFMRATKFFVLLGIIAVAVWSWNGSSAAFHDGGVAHCNGCHTMHNSQDGQLVDPDHPNGNVWLLTDASPSDVCLQCHATRSGAVSRE